MNTYFSTHYLIAFFDTRDKKLCGAGVFSVPEPRVHKTLIPLKIKEFSTNYETTVSEVRNMMKTDKYSWLEDYL